MGRGEKRGHSPSQPTSSRRVCAHYVFYLVVIGSVVLPVIAYYISGSLQHTQSHTNPQQDIFNVKNVNRTRLSSSYTRDTYRHLAEKREPMIIVNSIANQWKAREYFTTKFFAERLSTVSVYTQSKRSFITFHDNKPLEDHVDAEKWTDYNIKSDITIPELLGWGRHHDDTVWRYYSQEVTQLVPVFPDILAYIQPLKPLILDKDSLQVNLWIGRRGIITHTHYDATYNFFVQLQGRKRFTLFSPDQPMYLYPCLHPHYGHSQVDILSTLHNQTTLYPSLASAQAVVAELGPGDMLVVPPYWFHHVETLEESVSVNVWSNAPEYHLMDNIYSLPIPFEDSWEWMELSIATCIYSEMIINSIKGDATNYRSFMREFLVDQRYLPLVSTGKLRFNDSCYGELSDAFNTLNRQEKLSQYSPLLEGGITELQKQFFQINEESIRAVCIGNYIEHLIHRAVGLECLYGLLLVCSDWH